VQGFPVTDFVIARRAGLTGRPLCLRGGRVVKKLRTDIGFTLIELLIVVAIISVLASIGVAQVIRARASANESAAIGSMRALNGGQMSYASGAGAGGFATSLSILATPCLGVGVGFISPDLDPSLPGASVVGTGLIKSGYVVDLVGNGALGIPDCNGAPTNTDYVATAVPLTPGMSGQRGFNTSGAGTIFFDATGLATGTTPIQ
jgi:prepilin-type N-terminal cleavage/methylation domain-containing protein